MQNNLSVLVKPLVTEKSSSVVGESSVYTFVVNKNANKRQIKAAIESYYNVKVLSVNTAIIAGKTKRTQNGSKKSSSYKKAIFTVAPGQKIEFFNEL